MKLYYAPGACSQSPHIVAREAGIELQLEKVDLKAKRTESGRDYLEINPKGYVPALELDDGQVLTEGPAIVQYLADLRPEAQLAPAHGTLERVRLQEMLGYVNSELHKTYTPLFKPATPAEVREERKAYLRQRYELVERRLAERPYLSGERFGIADAYLFVVTNWAGAVGLDLGGFDALAAFQRRVAERPAVQAALRAEGLAKAA
jgi:glutathione S-transferase